MSIQIKHNLVYKTTNIINNNIYIGVHVTKNINDKYLGSGKILRMAIEKYGIENFKKEVLFDFDTLELAYSKEKELVNEEFIKRDDVYNIATGGTGNSWKHMIGAPSNRIGKKHSEETKYKMRLAKIGKPLSEPHRDKIRISNTGENNGFYGKKHSEETKLKMKKAKIGKLSNMSGKTHSEEIKKHWSEIRKGSIPWNKGKKQSPEYNKKITESRRQNKMKKDNGIDVYDRAGKLIEKNSKVK